ncbi:MAG: desulfoferrodoxin family protein [Halobacteriota archaeon]
MSFTIFSSFFTMLNALEKSIDFKRGDEIMAYEMCNLHGLWKNVVPIGVK